MGHSFCNCCSQCACALNHSSIIIQETCNFYNRDTLPKIVKIIVDTSPVEGKLQRHEMDMINSPMMNTALTGTTPVYKYKLCIQQAAYAQESLLIRWSP